MHFNEVRSGPVGWVLFRDLGYSSASLLPLQEALATQGARVVIATLPGEAEIAEAYRQIGAHDMIRAARMQTLDLLSECREVCLFGHGMGGLLALQMAEELPVKGVLAAAPTLALPTKYSLFSGILSQFRPYLPHGDETESSGIREKGIPTVALGMVRELASRVLSDAASIRCRVRILVPEADGWSDPDVALRLAQALAHGKGKRMEGACHQCLREEALETVITAALGMQAYASGKETHA